MGYYMGDYYGRRFPRMRRGDPGFFSVLGSLAKSALGFIPGVGPIAEKAADILIPKAPREAAGVVSKAIDVGRGVIKQGGAIVKKHPVLTAAGGAGAIAVAAGAHHLLAAHGGGRRHRRMNVCNPRALRRAIRRTHGFARLAMKTIHLVHPKKKARFGGFRKKRSRK